MRTEAICGALSEADNLYLPTEGDVFRLAAILASQKDIKEVASSNQQQLAYSGALYRGCTSRMVQ